MADLADLLETLPDALIQNDGGGPFPYPQDTVPNTYPTPHLNRTYWKCYRGCTAGTHATAYDTEGPPCDFFNNNGHIPLT